MDIFTNEHFPQILSLLNQQNLDLDKVNQSCRNALVAYQTLKGQGVTQKGPDQHTSTPEKKRPIHLNMLSPLPTSSPDDLLALELSARDHSLEESTEFPCTVCQNECNDQSVWCDLGEHWIHYSCAGLTQTKILELENPHHNNLTFECCMCLAQRPDMDTGGTATHKDAEQVLPIQTEVRNTHSDSDSTEAQQHRTEDLNKTLRENRDPKDLPESHQNTRVSDKSPRHNRGTEELRQAHQGPGLTAENTQEPEHAPEAAIGTIVPRNPALVLRDDPIPLDRHSHRGKRHKPGENQAPAQTQQDNSPDDSAARILQEKEKSIKTKERNLQVREKQLKEQEMQLSDISKQLACSKALIVKLEDDIRLEREENRFLRLRVAAMSDNPTARNISQPTTDSENSPQTHLQLCRLENEILRLRLEQSNNQNAVKTILHSQSETIAKLMAQMQSCPSHKTVQLDHAGRPRPRYRNRRVNQAGKKPTQVFEYSHGIAPPSHRPLTDLFYPTWGSPRMSNSNVHNTYLPPDQVTPDRPRLPVGKPADPPEESPITSGTELPESTPETPDKTQSPPQTLDSDPESLPEIVHAPHPFLDQRPQKASIT